MEGMKNWTGTTVAGLNSNATRTVRGAICFNSSTHFPPSAGSPLLVMKPVMLPPGCARFETKPPPIGSDTPANTIGCAHTEDRIGPQIDQLFCQLPHRIRISGAPAKFDAEVAAFRPAQLRERSPERREPSLRG